VPEPLIPRLLSLGVSDVDPDYVRLDVTAADGQFAGYTEIFGGLSTIADLASHLDGFPRSADDRREIRLGSLSPTAAGGWVRLLCRCIDRAGHAVIEIELTNKYTADRSAPRTAQVHLRVDPPAIDDFVRALRAWDGALGSEVTLRGAA